MPGIPWHLYLGWNGHTKNKCMGQQKCFTHPMLCCELATPEGREVGWSNHGQSYLLSLTSVINTSTTRMAMLTSTHLPSLYIRHFTLYQLRKLWEMSKWMHRVSYSPALEECHLSDAGPVIDNSHFVMLPQPDSSEFVPLGCWWCTWPTWPSQSYRDESPLLK